MTTPNDTKGLSFLKEVIYGMKDGEQKEILKEVELWASFGRDIHNKFNRNGILTYTQMEDSFEKVYKVIYE